MSSGETKILHCMPTASRHTLRGSNSAAIVNARGPHSQEHCRDTTWRVRRLVRTTRTAHCRTTSSSSRSTARRSATAVSRRGRARTGQGRAAPTTRSHRRPHTAALTPPSSHRRPHAAALTRCDHRRQVTRAAGGRHRHVRGRELQAAGLLYVYICDLLYICELPAAGLLARGGD